VSLLGAIYLTDGYPSVWPEDPVRWIDESGFAAAWVAQAQDGIVGHVALRRSGLVTRLMVAPWARRRRIATRLLEAARSHGTELGMPVALDVVESRHAAVALYERAGWRPAALATDATGRRVRRYLAP
jgi:[ribosomal protein S18]-alanine N-acetyltransferase